MMNTSNIEYTQFRGSRTKAQVTEYVGYQW